MTSQIFKTPIPNDMLFKCLDLFAIKNEKCYIINSNMFKKGVFNNSIVDFIELCKSHYFISKRIKYLERKLTYSSFITILRQICKNNKIVYTSQIKYADSEYDIHYFIYYLL